MSNYYRYDKGGLYTHKERELTAQFLERKISEHELPFNLLPEYKRYEIMSELDAFFPTTCPCCGETDEAAFLSHVGMKHCQHCKSSVAYVSIILLPSVDRVKGKIFELSGRDMNIINSIIDEIGKPKSWIDYWGLYIKVRNHGNKRGDHRKKERKGHL